MTIEKTETDDSIPYELSVPQKKLLDNIQERIKYYNWTSLNLAAIGQIDLCLEDTADNIIRTQLIFGHF